MIWDNNKMKELREQAGFSIDDMRVLLGHKSWASLSRVEAGKMAPTRDMLIIYYLVFDTPIHELLDNELIRTKRKLVKRCREYMHLLLNQGKTVFLSQKIRSFQKIYDANKNN